jgi:hypothetical protein
MLVSTCVCLWLIPGLTVATVAAAIALWPQIRAWSEEAVFPWLERNLPDVVPHVRTAFAAMDNAVTSVRRNIKQAWNCLREHLLHQLVILERSSSFQWIRRVTSWMVKVLSNGQRVPVQIVTETAFATDDLPAEVRSEWLRQGRGRHEIKATELRDREMNELY